MQNRRALLASGQLSDFAVVLPIPSYVQEKLHFFRETEFLELAQLRRGQRGQRVGDLFLHSGFLKTSEKGLAPLSDDAHQIRDGEILGVIDPREPFVADSFEAATEEEILQRSAHAARLEFNAQLPIEALI